MKINYKYLFLVFFSVLVITQFYQLEKKPMQPWDEAMYATRVDYLLDSGNWLDQTEGCIEGLYFSSHPPLYIWLTAVSVKLFGENTFGFRFWSLIFGLGSVLLLNVMSDNKKQGFFAAFILGTIPFFLAYSKLGQLDTIYPFFILSGLLFWKKYEYSNQIKYLIIVGVAFGLAMMSKIIVGFFLPMSIGLYLLYHVLSKSKSIVQAVKEFAIVLIVGLLISLPWLIFMYVKHGQEFLNYYLVYHIFDRMVEGVEFNTEKLGPVFFINQLLVMMSVFIWMIIWKSKTLLKNFKNETILYLCFAIVPFLIFTISTTKLRTYAIPMLPPLALLGGLALSQIKEVIKLKFVFVAGLVFFATWSVSQHFRDHVQAFEFDNKTIIIGGSAIIATLILAFLNLKQVLLVVLLGDFLILRALFVQPIEIHEHKMDLYSGINHRENIDYIINIDTKRTVDDPLITYYFNRIDIDKNPNFIKIRPENHTDFTLNEQNRNSLIIVNTYHENEHYKPYIEEIRSKTDLIFKDDLYKVYLW